MKKWTVGFAVLAMVLGLSLGFSVNPAESGAADVIKWGGTNRPFRTHIGLGKEPGKRTVRCGSLGQ